MKALAGGDLRVEIDGHNRRDEVGDLARAVQVFKVNAIVRTRLEAKALADRAEAETERERTSAERAAEEQAQVVGRLGEGLRSLAAGNLTFRLSEGFSAAYLQNMHDFNDARSTS